MSDVDARLATALGADAPPERDALFRLDVIARLERARFRRRILWTTTIGVVAAMLVAPAVDAWTAADARHGWIVGAAALAAMLALPGMPTTAVPGVRTVVKAFGRWFAG